MEGDNNNKKTEKRRVRRQKRATEGLEAVRKGKRIRK